MQGMCLLTIVVVVAIVDSSWAVPQDDVDWYALGKETLDRLKKPQDTASRAKNVILFVGDGMGLSTVSAARFYKGELKKGRGIEKNLVFEDFPNSALVKPYVHTHLVPGSGATATAMLTGVKTSLGLIGVNHHQAPHNCTGLKKNKLDNIFRWAQTAGKSTGIVSTARITHATPAAAYAHTPDRGYEAFVGHGNQEDPRSLCTDIAMQLVTGTVGKGLNVILGGGRQNFLPRLYPQSRRRDNRDLIQEWKNIQKNRGNIWTYVTNKEELMAVDTSETDRLLGLFSLDHMAFELERHRGDEPSLAEMTETAIKTLQTNDEGFVLLVEGARIDHAHHGSLAKAALLETLALEKAVESALTLTSLEDTLILVTADHSHTLTIGGGYPTRENSMLGTVDYYDPLFVPTDGKPMTVLSYANGPGGMRDGEDRRDPNSFMHTQATDANNYVFQSLVHMASETHSAEDVAVYASGPMSHLVRGVLEQNVLGHVMASAACVGEYADDQDCLAWKKQQQQRGKGMGTAEESTAEEGTAEKGIAEVGVCGGATGTDERAGRKYLAFPVLSAILSMWL